MIADSSTVGFVLIDGYSIRGVSTDIKDPGLERHTKELLFLGDTLKHKKLTGISSCEIEQTGVFDDAAGSIHAALKTPANDRVFSWAACGNTIGKHFAGALVDQVSYNPTDVQGDDFVNAQAKYSCSQREDGLIIAHLLARGAAGDTSATYVDNAASSALGGVGYLQLSALTLGGYTNLVVKVRHSADHVSWADLLTFTAKTAIGAERVAVATNPINRYLCVSWAWTGAGASASAGGSTRCFKISAAPRRRGGVPCWVLWSCAGTVLPAGASFAPPANWEGSQTITNNRSGLASATGYGNSGANG